MPNNGRYTLCPFYRDEKNKSISCEDVCRTFRYPVQKKRWMDKYCDKHWQDCPYAIKLNEMYDKVLEKGANMDIEQLKLKNEELDKELKKVKSFLGKADKQSRDKDELIKKLRRDKDALVKEQTRLEEIIKKYRTRCKTLDRRIEERDEEKKVIANQMGEIAILYEERYAYLMDKFGNGKFDMLDFEKWQGGKEYAIVPTKYDPSDNNRAIEYTAVIKEKKGGKNVS